jgi:hypothetical protein
MNLIDLKERIAIGAELTPEQRSFVLDCINAQEPVLPGDPRPSHPNYLARIDSIWAYLSVDEGGEGVCAAPIGGITVPMIAADKRRLDILRPIAQMIARHFGKPVRLVQFTKREELEIFNGS